MKRKTLVLSTSLFCIALLCVSIIAFAANPGTEQDPLVTKSYVDKLVSDAVFAAQTQNQSAYVPKTDIDTIINSTVNPKIDAFKNDGTNFGYKLITLAPGEKIIAKQGTEFILRSGLAVCTSDTASIGVYDFTTGGFVGNGEAFTVNHYYVFTRDQRGLTANSECNILIRGSYTKS